MELQPSSQPISDRNKVHRLPEQDPLHLNEGLVNELTRDRAPFDHVPGRMMDLRRAGIASFPTEQEQQEKLPGLKCDLTQELGKGGFGIVYYGHLKDRETSEWNEVAIKTCKLRLFQDSTTRVTDRKKSMLISAVLAELLFWRKVNGHPFITFLYDALRVRDAFWFVVELMHGDMYDVINTLPKQRFPILQARQYFTQIVSGVNFMHSQGIAHRDIKLHNMLCKRTPNGMLFKVADFGLSCCAWTTKEGIVWQRNFGGTLTYMPPESLFHRFKKEYTQRRTPRLRDETELTARPVYSDHALPVELYRKYLLNEQRAQPAGASEKKIRLGREYANPDSSNSMACDTWALGVTLFIMTHGKYPTILGNQDGVKETFVDLMRGRVPKFRFVPQELREFIRLMLEANPTKRATIRDIASHDWLRDNPPSRVFRSSGGASAEESGASRSASRRKSAPAARMHVPVPGPETGAVPKARRRPSYQAAVDAHAVSASHAPITATTKKSVEHGAAKKSSSHEKAPIHTIPLSESLGTGGHAVSPTPVSAHISLSRERSPNGESDE